MKRILFLSILAIAGMSVFSQNSSVNNKFAFKLLNKTTNNKENVIISPYSVYEALGQVYLGAEGTTKTEISNVLDIDKNKISQLKKYRKSLLSKQDSLTQINIANGIWIKPDFKTKFCYRKRLNKYFNTKVYKLENAKQVNFWVSENTNNKIKKVVDDNDVNNSDLIITNAIYFKAKWETEFMARATKDKEFTSPEGKIKVPTMYKHSHFLYMQNKKFQAIELPYKGKKFSLLVVLPNENAKNLALSEDVYSQILNSLSKTDVKLSLPKLKSKTSLDLKDNLSQMGMKSAFGKDANFKKMAKKQLFISKVIHKTFFNIDETGTEAAAVTAVTMRTTNFNPKVVKMEVNRPYFIILKDNENNNILFIGKINNPLK